MNQKTKGIITSVGTVIILVVLAVVISVIVSLTSTDGWAGLVVAMMMFFATVIVIVILLIIGIVKYYKHKSQFGLGIIYGTIGIVACSIVISLIISIYNAFV